MSDEIDREGTGTVRVATSRCGFLRVHEPEAMRKSFCCRIYVPFAGTRVPIMRAVRGQTRAQAHEGARDSGTAADASCAGCIVCWLFHYGHAKALSCLTQTGRTEDPRERSAANFDGLSEERKLTQSACC